MKLHAKRPTVEALRRRRLRAPGHEGAALGRGGGAKWQRAAGPHKHEVPLNWWFGFGFEPLLLVEHRWDAAP